MCSTMEVLRVVCSVIVVAVVVNPLPHPWDPQLDEGVWDNLLEYGEKLFGDPSKSVGNAKHQSLLALRWVNITTGIVFCILG